MFEIDHVSFLSQDLVAAARMIHQFFIGDVEDLKELKRGNAIRANEV